MLSSKQPRAVQRQKTLRVHPTHKAQIRELGRLLAKKLGAPEFYCRRLVEISVVSRGIASLKEELR